MQKPVAERKLYWTFGRIITGSQKADSWVPTWNVRLLELATGEVICRERYCTIL